MRHGVWLLWLGARRLLRRAPLELLLVTTSVLLVLGSTIATIKVARSTERSRDLIYADAVRELSNTLQGLEPDSVARVVSARVPIAGEDTLSVDTLAIVADTMLEPALATGGFVQDQIASFNEAAVRRAVVSRGRTVRRDAAPAPASVFRVVRTQQGGFRLADRAEPSVLVVRSPYAESGWRPVNTADAMEEIALVGHQGYAPLGTRGTAYSSLLNGRKCHTVLERNQSKLYCDVLVSSGSGRFFDLAVARMESSNQLHLETYRTRPLWVDGRRLSFRSASVAHGTVGEFERTGPFLLSGTHWGRLASPQWVNGRTIFANQPAGTIGFFGRAGRSARWPEGGGPLVLSLDAALSQDLDVATRAFFDERAEQLDLMAVVVADVATGRVRAISEPWRDSPDQPLASFEPRLVGSVVKPIVAAAILARQPALGELAIDYGGPSISMVGGASLARAFENDRNGCDGRIGFDEFLRCSNNQYAAELLARSMKRNGFVPEARPGAIVPSAVIERSDLADGLSALFDVDPYEQRTGGRTVPFWEVPNAVAPGRSDAVSDPSLVPYESRPWLLAHGAPGTSIDWLARYAFGGWENRWTLLGIAQSYVRIASGREIVLSFLDASASRAPVAFSGPSAAALARVRRALREVGATGTARGLNDALGKSLGGPNAVLAKTGTLKEAGDDVAIKALAIVVGRPETNADAAAFECGLAIVLYFDFSRQAVNRLGTESLPPVHTDFATQHLPSVLARHWNRLSGCHGSSQQSTN